MIGKRIGRVRRIRKMKRFNRKDYKKPETFAVFDFGVRVYDQTTKNIQEVKPIPVVFIIGRE